MRLARCETPNGIFLEKGKRMVCSGNEGQKTLAPPPSPGGGRKCEGKGGRKKRAGRERKREKVSHFTGCRRSSVIRFPSEPERTFIEEFENI